MSSMKQAITTPGAVGLSELPPELLDIVLAHLSKHDLTVCARVSKTWYQAVINKIWNTFDLAVKNYPVGFVPKDGYSYPFGIAPMDSYAKRDTSTAPTAASLAKNLKRIRALKIRHISILNLFAGVSTVTSGRDGLPSLQELDVDFNDDTTFLELTRQLYAPRGQEQQEDPPRGILIETIFLILAQCQEKLVKFTIGLESITILGQFVDQARLWSALPASLEQLIISDRFYNKKSEYGRHLGLSWKTQIEWMKRIANSRIEQLRASSLSTSSLTTWIKGDCDAGGSPPALKSLNKLKIISIDGIWTDIQILVSVLTERQCGPALEELTLVRASPSLTDFILASLISMAGRNYGSGDDDPDSGVDRRTGLKTFAYHSCVSFLGPLTASAILRQSTTLENLRIDIGYQGNREGLSSESIQKLLCSAPRLKRFDTIPVGHQPGWHPNLLMAKDILQTGTEEWVCLNLESFKCMIGGVPRPDLKIMTNGRRLRDEYHDPSRCSQEESRSIQRKILVKFSGMTKLRELSLGHDSIGLEDWDPDEMFIDDDDDDVDDEALQFTCDHQTGYQYTCLSMRLEDGFDQLKNLKSMRRMHLWRMAQGQGAEEEAWIQDNWPDYGKECRDDFFTKRGLEVTIGQEIRETHGRYHDLKTAGLASWDPESMDEHTDEEHDGSFDFDPQTGYQYACLSMGLKDGLDHLKNPKYMLRMRL
ncbi:hypothetical protein BGZ83_011348 [Gryganskiella cystojenkinii]|nr:hypothetical protein BGZ83_011348 [Gryganskiella cystojenkinii]